MHNITDYIVLGALLYFLYKGWRKGFLKTLFGPISMIAACLIGYNHYQKTENMMAGLAICIIGPFLLTILASLILKLWHKAVNSDFPLSPVSRIAGSAFSILWGGSYLAMMLILIAVSPIKFGWIERAQNDVLASKTYSFIKDKLGDKIPNGIFDMKKITSVLQDPAKLEKFESTEEFQAVREDARLKELLTDEETAGQIRDQDYAALLSNPKMQAIFNDKELLEKIFALNKKIAEESITEEPGPKVLTIQPN